MNVTARLRLFVLVAVVILALPPGPAATPTTQAASQPLVVRAQHPRAAPDGGPGAATDGGPGLVPASSPAAPSPAFVGAPSPVRTQRIGTQAAAFTVNSTADAVDASPGDGSCETSTGNGVCTLRAAIQEANALAGADAINVPSGTYTLTIAGRGETAGAQGDLNVKSDLTITGAGAGVGGTIIDGAGIDRIFQIDAGTTVSISNLVIQNGNTGFNNTVGNGAGITNSGSLFLEGVVVRNNHAVGTPALGFGFSGGISNMGGTLRINFSTITDNTADANCGGIGQNNNGASTTISFSTISTNHATGTANGFGSGGGFCSGSNGTTEITIHSTIVSGNTAASVGGGMAAFSGSTLSITTTSVTGNASGDDGAGINAFTGSTLILTSSTISSNTTSGAGDGAGVTNSGNASLDTVQVTQNQAAGFGGGLADFSGGVMTLTNSTVTGNTSNQNGGGFIVNNDANAPGTSLTITGSTISSNTAVKAGGGGATGTNTALIVNGSTFSGNHANNGNGGGIAAGFAGAATAGSLSVVNSTFSGNTTSGGGGGIATSMISTIINSTIASNTASVAGGGIDTCCIAPQVQNTIVANNAAPSLTNCRGVIASQGNNLEFPGGTCGLSAGLNDLLNMNPLLGPLQNNGGAALTHGLDGNSPAVDAGSNANCPATDQRGVARPNDGNGDGAATCDIGAVEASVVTLTVSRSGTGDGTITGSGVTCGPVCQRAYALGRTVTLVAEAAAQSSFTGWSGACTGTGTCQVTMDAAKSITATFTSVVPSTFRLAVTKAGAGSGTVASNPAGIDCGADCVESYASGTSLTLTATPSAGSVFAGWNGDCTGTGACQVTMNAAKSVMATFQRENVGIGIGRSPDSGSGLTATLTARPGCGVIDRIQFGSADTSFSNARVTITSPASGLGGQTDGFTYTPPPGTTSVSLTIQRVVPSGGATVSPILFYDGCGEWRTFVGGGSAAFQ